MDLTAFIHGGFKYYLAGSLTKAASAVRRMPGLWRQHLTGQLRWGVRGATPEVALEISKVLWRGTERLGGWPDRLNRLARVHLDKANR